MSNSVYNLKNIPSMPERVLSALAYLTLGTVGIILIITSAIIKTNLKPFVKFNVYQSILLGAIFTFIQLTYQVISGIFELIGLIPFLGSFINSFVQFILYYIMKFPILFGFSLLASIIIGTIIYLTTLSMMGKLPYIPYISRIIKEIAQKWY